MDKKYILSDEVVNNLIYFLDRVATTGHNERNVMNQIMVAITTPIQEENNLRGENNDG